MNPVFSQDWHSWLPATQVAFARILQAKNMKKYQPTYQDLTNICMFPLGNNVAVVKAWVRIFLFVDYIALTCLIIEAEANIQRERSLQHLSPWHG